MVFFSIFAVILYFSFLMIVFASVALQLIGCWFTFKKMHLPGWKGIIPYYSTYVLFEKLWDVKMFWRMIIYLGVYTGTFIFGYILTALGGVFAAEKSIAGIIVLIIGLLTLLASLVFIILMMVIQYRLYQRMAAAFGLQDGWAWGLLFVPYIMLPIIGFNRRIVYYGPVNQA